MSHPKKRILTITTLVSVIVGLSACYVFGGQMIDLGRKALALMDTPAKVDRITVEVAQLRADATENRHNLERIMFYLSIPTNNVYYGQVLPPY